MDEDYSYADVKCALCGTYLGNYMTGDYYKLIRLKYCPKCKTIMYRENKRAWEQKKRHAEKMRRKEDRQKIQSLEQENEALKAQLIELNRQLCRRKK